MEHPTISNTESALLGLLSEEPMHPYQIEQEVKYRNMRFWTELSMSSIYKLLRKLEKAGLVIREDIISPENRLRKLYAISELGKKALKIKLKEILSTPDHTRWPIDIGMYNSDLLPDKTVRKSLLKYKTHLEENIQGYKGLLKFLKDSGCPPHRFELAKRPVFLLEAEIKWIDSYIENR